MANDYTKLFLGSKVPPDSESSWITDSLRQTQAYINNTGRSAGATSNLTVPMATDGSLTNLPAEIAQWDYFQIITKSTTAGIMTLRDPGIYLATANVSFTGLSTSGSTVEVIGVTTTGSLSNPLLAATEELGLGNSVYINAVTNMKVTTVPTTIKIQANVNPGSTSARAQLSAWVVTRLFPIPSNRG